jgi:hypothetical protein
MTKQMNPRLAVVTATLNPGRAAACLQSWADRAAEDFIGVLVWSGTMDPTKPEQEAWMPDVDHKAASGNIILTRREILGVVPAFALGVEFALKHTQAEVIACLHDDLLIEQDGWDQMVMEAFDQPEIGLVGFGGGTGLGDSDIYQTPYSPYQLARQGFVSHMREAERHGTRVEHPVQVACLDGFSQVGRREYWEAVPTRDLRGPSAGLKPGVPNILQQMADWGLVHHAYDAALGAWAKRLGWQVWMLPVRCHHLGGQTAVGDPRYAEWAESIVPGGDKTFWELAHKEVYERFRDVLPIRVGG